MPVLVKPKPVTRTPVPGTPLVTFSAETAAPMLNVAVAYVTPSVALTRYSPIGYDGTVCDWLNTPVAPEVAEVIAVPLKVMVIGEDTLKLVPAT